MKTVRMLSIALLAIGMTTGTCCIAQQPSAGATASQGTASAQAWTAEQLITSSVHDAWVLSGRNEQTFFQMVAQLAQISAQKRGLTLPDSEAAGKHFGELIKSMAKADTDQLLYVVVDKAVQQVGTKS